MDIQSQLTELKHKMVTLIDTTTDTICAEINEALARFGASTPTAPARPKPRPVPAPVHTPPERPAPKPVKPRPSPVSAAAAVPATAGKKPRKLRPRSNMSPEQLEGLEAQVSAHLRSASEPIGAEAISKALNVDGHSTSLVLKKLVTAGTLRTSGIKRGTKYAVAGKGSNGAVARA